MALKLPNLSAAWAASPLRIYGERLLRSERLRSFLAQVEAQWASLPFTQRLQQGLGRWVSLSILGAIVAYFIFFLGLKHSFPGEAIARYAQQQLMSQGVYTQIMPLELGFTRLTSERLTLLTPPALAHVPVSKLFILEEIKTSWISLLLGSLKLQAKAYEGQVTLNMDLKTFNPFGLALQEVRLDQIPLLNLIPYVILNGKVSILGNISNLKELATRQQPLPTGSFLLKSPQLSVQPKNLEELMPGLNLPLLELQDIVLDVDYGQIIKIKQFTFTGALAGSIEGTIELNPNQWALSQFHLHLNLKLSEEITQALGPFNGILQGFQCKDRFDLDLNGNFSAPLPQKRACP